MRGIGSWSGKRIIAIWIVGLLLQVVITVTPIILALRNAPALRAQMEMRDARMRIGKRADSISIARQRSRAQIVTVGESRAIGVVSVPSWTYADYARLGPRRVPWALRAVSALYFYAIPTLLGLVTVVWWRERGRVQIASANSATSGLS